MNTVHALPAASPATVARLRVSGLHINLGSVEAISGIDLDVGPGELVAITGEPGSGKTTLMRAIAGDLVHDAGTIAVDGRVCSPVEGDRPGVALVWQDLELCENLDVAVLCCSVRSVVA